MSPKDLDSELKREPFQPFRIVTTDGKTYDVRLRDRPMIWIGQHTVLIGFRVAETDPFFDRYEVVSLPHVVRLEPLPHTQTQAS